METLPYAHAFLVHSRLDKTNGMSIRSIVREIPDFAPEEAGFPEDQDYMRALGGA